MSLFKPGKIVYYISLIIFLTACGQLDTVFSPTGTYRVSARAAAYTLDECAIVESGTPIYPYFIGSVADDPDLRGLTVFLQSTGGETISRKVQYVLPRKPEADTLQGEAGGLPVDSDDTGYADTGYEAGQDSQAVPADESSGADTGLAGSSTDTGGLESDSPETSLPDLSGYSSGDPAPAGLASGGMTDDPDKPGDASVSAADGFPSDPPASPDLTASGLSSSSDPVSSDSSSAPDPASPDWPSSDPSSSPDPVSSGLSSSSEPTSSSGPSSLDPSSSDVSSSSYSKDTPETDLGGSVRETGYTGSLNERSSGNSDTGGISQRNESSIPDKSILRLQENTDLIIEIAHIEGDLTPFLLPEGLEIGQYKLVFQVVGDRGVLNRIEKPIYYVADALFSLNAFNVYLPGGIEGSSIVPPGTNVMLEVQVVADKRLEPYVVWYNGKKRIGEGGVIRSESQGGSSRAINQFFWKAPAQTGFHTLRVEVLPFRPRSSSPGGMGRIKEMSLPVSSKQEGRGYFANTGDSLLRWYQFRGSLQDTKTPGADLIPLNGALVQWLPYAGVYGLALRPGDTYSIPDVSFVLPGDKLGKGQILFRVAPFAGGIIFSGSFVLGESSADTLDLNLEYDGNDLILTCAAGTGVLRRTVAVESPGSEEFITPVINFEIEPDRFRADISLSVTDTFIGEGEIPLKASAGGNGRFRIGGKKDEAKRADPRFEAQENVPSADETAVDAGSGTGGEDGASAPAQEAAASGRGTELFRESDLSPETASTTAYGNSPMILDELVIMFSLEAPLRETSLTLEDGEEEPVANEKESPEEAGPEIAAPEQASAEKISSGDAAAETTALESAVTETAAPGSASARTTASERAATEKGEIERASAAVPPDQTTAGKLIEKPVPEGVPEKITAKTPAPEEEGLAAEGDTPPPKSREPEGDTGIGKAGETVEILEQLSGNVSVRPADSVSPALFEHP
ncbi:MAG: hypothetical protein LBD78_07210 [Spirochaetaceae bacterium]|jgi:hypothetical protein|nr:hypothetical protein [Spirochaetaceae bacterium]